MIPYVIAGAVLLLLLIAAYRVLGGAASAPVPARTLIDAAYTGVRAVSDELRDGADLRAARRRLDAAQQQLQQVDVAALGDELAAVHALVGAAVDELQWAVRIMQSPAYGTATGLESAVSTLRGHAAQCVSAASVAVGQSGAAEEVDSPA